MSFFLNCTNTTKPIILLQSTSDTNTRLMEPILSKLEHDRITGYIFYINYTGKLPSCPNLSRFLATDHQVHLPKINSKLFRLNGLFQSF